MPHFKDRLRCLCLGYLVFILAYSVMPLDVILSRSEWDARVATGTIRWNPFQIGLADTQNVKGLFLGAMRMGPLGLLLALSAWRRRAVWSLLLLPIAFELLQLPLYSKHVTSVEIVGGWFGGAVGYVLGTNLGRLQVIVRQPILWGAAWMTALAVTLAALLLRYDEFLRDPTEIARRFSGAWELPLVRYYSGSEYSALTNMLMKIGLFALLGTFTFGWQKTSSPRVRHVVVWTTLIVIIVAAFTIEVAQILLPPHVPDISDVITYLLGYGAGYQVAKLLWGQAPAKIPVGGLHPHPRVHR